MKYLRHFYIIIFLFLLNSPASKASHIVGCEIHYQYLGNNVYEVTLKVYRNCYDPMADYPDPLILAVYDTAKNLILRQEIPFPGADTLSNNTNNPCLIAPPNVCVQEAIYKTQITLQPIPGGYDLCWQQCCRNAAIINIVNPDAAGASYIVHIPEAPFAENSDPLFTNFPPIVICADYPISFDHSAIDADGDSLAYFICAPFTSPGVSNPDPPLPPPYDSVTYTSSFNSQDALGGTPPLSIDAKTGLITGNPTILGKFVVCVGVREYRNGVLINVHKRDFQFNVTSCTKAVQAVTAPQISNCDNLTVTFPNTSKGGSTYFWDFGVPGTNTDTSFKKTPTFTYPDTGTYHVTMYVNRFTSCEDSTNVLVRLYPLQIPHFTGPDTACSGTLIQFFDQSTYSYGSITGWNWYFGDTTARVGIKDPRHFFKWGGNYTIHLSVTNDIGCVDSTTRPIVLLNGPILSVFGDSICIGDTTLIGVTKNPTQNGTFSWSPNYNVVGGNLDTTVLHVYPAVTTPYIVTGISPNGCINHDTLVVKVFDTVVAKISSDTTICPNTKATLVGSGGTKFLWAPSNSLSNTDNDTTFYTGGPFASSKTYTFTTYVGKIGGMCSDTKSVTVFIKPLPALTLTNEKLCLGDSLQLSPLGPGTQFHWAPDTALSDNNIRNPWASPTHDITYYVTATDNSGNYCPIVLKDSIEITVITNKHSVSHDTIIALGTTAHLRAFPDNVTYSWAPSNTLNSNTISNPSAVPTQTTTYTVTFTFADGCQATDTIVVVTDPAPIVVFPNAFTPDGDGHNDIFRPIHYGAITLETFKVFNRWGQVIFETNNLNVGWDGTFKGKLQPIGAYAYYFAGHATETGTKVEVQGNVTLVR